VDFSQSHKWKLGEEKLIRTYVTKGAAQKLLTAWLQGKFYGDHDGYTSSEPQKHRRAEDMEIVALTLHLPD
jgi:hypothetical protein